MEARRRRQGLEHRLAALRTQVDRELGDVLVELQLVERLEREGERQMRALERETHPVED